MTCYWFHFCSKTWYMVYQISWNLFTLLLSSSQMTTLHLAAETARIRMVNYLVEQGAGINIQDYLGVLYVTIHTSAASIPD